MGSYRAGACPVRRWCSEGSRPGTGSLSPFLPVPRYNWRHQNALFSAAKAAETLWSSRRAIPGAGSGPRSDGWALALLAHTSDVVAQLDAAGRVVYVNAAVERLLGITPEELYGRDGEALLHPDDLPNVRDRLTGLGANSASAQPIVYRLRHADGSWRWVESVAVNGLADPAVLGLVITTRDATERQRAEEALRQSERLAQQHLAAAQRAVRELALLDRIRTALARQLDLPSLFQTVVESVAATFGYSQVSLYLREGEAAVLQHQVGYERVLARIPIALGISGRVLRTGQSVLLTDVGADPEFLGAIVDIRSEVCVPLHDGKRTVGFLNLESTGDRRLGPADLTLMEALAEHVEIAIGRARLYQEARLSEEQFRTAFTSSAIGMALVALDGRWLAVNPALCQIVGYTAEELEQRTFQEITHPDDLDEDARLMGLLQAGAIPALHFEKRYLHKQGHVVWVFVTGSLVHSDDGEPLSILGQVQDVTERR